jgi:hypothetical protein
MTVSENVDYGLMMRSTIAGILFLDYLSPSGRDGVSALLFPCKIALFFSAKFAPSAPLR